MLGSYTIDEVAKAAGVSKSTVSRVLNRSNSVAPGIASSVRDAMDRLGYRSFARKPATKLATRRGVRTNSLLLLVCDRGGSATHLIGTYPALLAGIEKATQENDLKLVLATASPEANLPTALDAREVDGVLLFGRPSCVTAETKERLATLPAVTLVRGFEALGSLVDRVVYDNAAVGPLAAKYLLERGHRHMAFLNTDREHPAFIARLNDFTATAQAGGADVVSLISDERPMGFRQEQLAYSALADRLIQASPRPTALFISADYQAPFVYHALEDRGILPGRDIDVVACDRVPLFLDQLDPKPASIDINLELVGYRAVYQLLWRIANPDTVNRIKISIEPVLIPAAPFELA